MEKKISEIAQSFQRLKFQETISLIEQYLKKNAKQEKKKNPSSNEQMKVIQCFRVGALISLGRNHEAAPFYQELTRPEGIELMGKENPLLLISMSQLLGQSQERNVVQLLEKHCPTFDNSKMHRFYLNARLFSTLSKIFLKDFIASKNNASQLAQIYLEYLQNIERENMIESSRQTYYKYNPKLNFKLVHMFLEKALKSSEQSKLKLQKQEREGKIALQQRQKFQKQLKTNRSVVASAYELKLKLLITEGKLKESIALYHQIKESMKFPFVFIESILQLRQSVQARQEISHFYIAEISRIFRKNLNFDLYTPLYDHYHRFLTFIKEEAEKGSQNIKQSLKLSQSVLAFESLYRFDSSDVRQTFNSYFNSLNSEYRLLRDINGQKYQQNRKGDYYKICLKGLLLQLLEISWYVSDQKLLVIFLTDYTALFKNTLTYSNDLCKYWPLIVKNNILASPAEVSNDSQLIQEINFQKITISINRINSIDLEQLNLIYDHMVELYHRRLKQVQKNRLLDKGQRHISDEFLTILTDYVRIYIQKEDSQENIYEVIYRIIAELESGIVTSPFNADLKVRLIYFLSIVNHHQKLIEVYLTNDIKSVQMQTLGYMFLNVSIDFELWNNYDHFVSKMIRSYHQNQRQTSEYAYKALKAAQLDRVEEYLGYRHNILNSYNSLILQYMLYCKYRLQPNSEYFLLRINEKLRKHARGEIRLSFNADFKVLGNELDKEYSFVQVYGVYNSYNLLQRQIQVCLHEQAAINTLLQRNNDHITTSITELDKLQEIIDNFTTSHIYGFSSYLFQQETLTFEENKYPFTALRLCALFQGCKLGLKLRINVIRLVSLFIDIIKTQSSNELTKQISAINNKILANIKSLKQHFSILQYRLQIKSMLSIRRGLIESFHLISLIREFVSKGKKLKGVKVIIEEGAWGVSDELHKSILQWSWRVNTTKSAIFAKREQSVQKQLQMDSKQLKKMQTKYLNVYKM